LPPREFRGGDLQGVEEQPQGYYRWRASPVTERDWVDAHLVNAALDIHVDDPAFGYRFIADELPEKGITAGENRVQRLCRDHGIWSVFSKKRGLNRKPGPPVHDDLVERDFTAAAPNELWLTDITEHPTGEGKLYLCAVKDVYSGRIVGYSMDSRMKSSLAVSALENAVRARRPAGTVVHSDRGSQFRSRRFVESLRHHGLTGSMGRVGACRQRRDGIVLLAAAEERPGPSAMDHQTGTPAGHHDLDRKDLPPPATAKTAGKTHAHRK
jgi:putative transposase